MRGIDKFKERFAGHDGEYVLIGGGACDLLFSENPAMSEGVRADMRRFMEAYESDPVDPKALKIKGVGAQQVVEVLRSVYLR